MPRRGLKQGRWLHLTHAVERREQRKGPAGSGSRGVLCAGPHGRRAGLQKVLWVGPWETAFCLAAVLDPPQQALMSSGRENACSHRLGVLARTGCPSWGGGTGRWVRGSGLLPRAGGRVQAPPAPAIPSSASPKRLGLIRETPQPRGTVVPAACLRPCADRSPGGLTLIPVVCGQDGVPWPGLGFAPSQALSDAVVPHLDPFSSPEPTPGCWQCQLTALAYQRPLGPR